MRLTIPNQLTILRILLTPLFLYFFIKETTISQFIASIIYILASWTDWYDGWYARQFGVITRWGQFMDPLADKFLVSSALLLFAWMGYVKWWMVWIIVSRDVIVTLVRIYAIQKGTPIVTSAIAKWKTFIQMAVIVVVLIFINWLNFYGLGSYTYQAQYFDMIGILMLGITLLTLISAILYFSQNWKLIWGMLKRFVFFASK
ncbi:MAG: CDP-diacylglycerol--glycerol-3-phosphate 3-phosphatidyltransferase [Calditrichia bacterium]|nr:CDP-diacylglycerol--glycerol-3-phosphate 3-phosphatidyltransferase [Calditrichia bacterium]